VTSKSVTTRLGGATADAKAVVTVSSGNCLAGWKEHFDPKAKDAWTRDLSSMYDAAGPTQIAFQQGWARKPIACSSSNPVAKGDVNRGGSMGFFKKTGGTWKLMVNTQDAPLCSEVDGTGIPTTEGWVPSCYPAPNATPRAPKA
jgi:hypothetical protein